MANSQSSVPFNPWNTNLNLGDAMTNPNPSITGLSGAGVFAAIDAVGTAVSGISNIFAADSQAAMSDTMSRIAHQNRQQQYAANYAREMQIFKLQNEATLQGNIARVNAWKNQNLRIKRAWQGENGALDQWDFAKKVYGNTVGNWEDVTAMAYQRSFESFERQKRQAALGAEEGLREYHQALAPTEQAGASVERALWSKDLTIAYNERDSTQQQIDMGVNLGYELDDSGLRLQSGLNQAWANLGLPPMQPTFTTEPVMASGPMVAPVQQFSTRAPKARRSNWTDYAKVGFGAVGKIAGMDGGWKQAFTWG